ncbi:MAG: element excision factor XisI family protein, partial [Dolichospermum sp.]
MDKLTDYPKIIKQILREYVELSQNHPQKDIETFLFTDDEKGH